MSAIRYGALFVLLLGACGDEGRAPHTQDAAAPLDAGADAGDEGPDYLTTLATPDDYASLASSGELRYLVPIEGAMPEPPLDAACVFQNVRRYPFHIDLLLSLPNYAGFTRQAYLDLVLRRASRVFYGGMLKEWPHVTHPLSGHMGSLMFTAYQTDGPGESFTLDEIEHLHDQLATCVPYASETLVFVPSSPGQENAVREQRDALQARGVAVMMLDELPTR